MMRTTTTKKKLPLRLQPQPSGFYEPRTVIELCTFCGSYNRFHLIGGQTIAQFNHATTRCLVCGKKGRTKIAGHPRNIPKLLEIV